MFSAGLTILQRRVLEVLIIERPEDCYCEKLSSHTGIDYNTIQSILLRLVPLGLARFIRLAHPGRGGERRRLYGPTAQSVCRWLWIMAEEWSLSQERDIEGADLVRMMGKIRRAAGFHGYIQPLILGKWPLFERWNVENLAMKILAALNPLRIVGIESERTSDVMAKAFYEMAETSILSMREKRVWQQIFNDQDLAGFREQIRNRLGWISITVS